LTLDDCDRLIESARGSPQTVMVAFNLRWHRLVRRARELIQSGRIGPVDSIQTVLTGTLRELGPGWRTDRRLGGGVLLEKGAHHYDLWRYLLGSEVEEVSALSHSSRFDDELAIVTARIRNGALASTLPSDP